MVIEFVLGAALVIMSTVAPIIAISFADWRRAKC